MTPATILPQPFVQSPPVDIMNVRSGLFNDDCGDYHWIVSLRNRSSETQTVVVLLRTDIDHETRSEPVLLHPHEERTVVVFPEQPTSDTNLKEYISILQRPSLIRVEYAEELPPDSGAKLFVDLIFRALFFVVGAALLGVGQYISRKKPRSHRA